ncbi:DUF2336 domain-containing protein [Roseospira marina]|nr:DUF2336 domain-containing protein [Roseospira marina]MBB4312246.1 uncharacterized protein (DUF2336 family) [Roseospira marina]MBB5085738.1 uncharacterized protein (DUF2336 family) [Roseospira marina]
MSDLLDRQNAALDDSELGLVTDILRNLIYKVEGAVRHRLVNLLADNSRCPRDLIWFLANEPIDVAYPILLRSAVLRDMDLIELLHHKAIEHRIAIARRPNLPKSVSEALAHDRESPVILELLNNESAQIAEVTLAYLVERSRVEREFQEPLLMRPEMTPDLAEMLYAWVSGALRTFILETWDVQPAVIDDGLDAVRTQNTLLPDDEVLSVRADALAEALVSDRGRLRSLCLCAMEGGDVRLAVSLISAGLGLRKPLVRRILFEEAFESLAIVCRALGMTRIEFLELRAIITEVRSKSEDGVADGPQAAGDFYDRVDSETACSVVAHWTQKSDPLGAVRPSDGPLNRRMV